MAHRNLKYYYQHKEEWTARKNAWCVKNRDKVRSYNKKTLLKIRYGLTLDEYSRMLASQNGKCAICYRENNHLNRKFAVDHDHATGKIRGLLCFHCNLGIGNLQDSTIVLQSAIQYLEKSKGD